MAASILWSVYLTLTNESGYSFLKLTIVVDCSQHINYEHPPQRFS